LEELEVRKRLERAMRRKLYDAVWKELLRDGYVKDFLEGELEETPSKNWRELREQAEKRMRLVEECKREYADKPSEDLRTSLTGDRAHIESSSSQWGEVVDEIFDLDYFVTSEKTRAMISATSHYFERLADQHPDVRWFREELLEGKTLVPDQAVELIASYAARFFPIEWFEEWGIPIIGHSSEIVGEYEDRLRGDGIEHSVTIRVTPPGVIKRVRYAPPDSPAQDEHDIRTHCELLHGEVILPYRIEIPNADMMVPGTEDHEAQDTSTTRQRLGPMLLKFETSTRPWFVWPGSVVDNLYAISEQLADEFRWPRRDTRVRGFGRWWRKEAAAEFVLTGVAPIMRPVDAELRLKRSRYADPQWRINLSVSPWMSAEEVERAYKRMQRECRGGKNTLPSPKTLRVACFVWEQEKRNGYKRPTWPVLLERWNEVHRKDSNERFKDYRHFRTYFKRGERTVKALNYGSSE
jgi:hypothetical protein